MPPYAWESKIKLDVVQAVVDGFLPKGVHVVGVVVAHMENAEGAFLPRKDFKPNGMTAADILLDAGNDIDKLRIEALKAAGLSDPCTAAELMRAKDADPLGR